MSHLKENMDVFIENSSSVFCFWSVSCAWCVHDFISKFYQEEFEIDSRFGVRWSICRRRLKPYYYKLFATVIVALTECTKLVRKYLLIVSFSVSDYQVDQLLIVLKRSAIHFLLNWFNPDYFQIITTIKEFQWGIQTMSVQMNYLHTNLSIHRILSK